METDFSGRMRIRARAIARHGAIDAAVKAGDLPKQLETSLSEGLVLGLLKQGVSKYLAIFGHGSTDLGEVLRVYEEEGVTRTWNFRNEVVMAHTATALAWQYGEFSAVITSIGPGGLQAMAGSLAAASKCSFCSGAAGDIKPLRLPRSRGPNASGNRSKSAVRR